MPAYIEQLRENQREMGKIPQESKRYKELQTESEKITNYLDKSVWSELTKATKTIDYEFDRWNEVKGQQYSQTYLLWMAQTNKVISSHETSRSLLEELYTLSHKSELGPVNNYFDKIMEKREARLAALTTEYVSSYVNPSRIAEVCDKAEDIYEVIVALPLVYYSDKTPKDYAFLVEAECMSASQLIDQSRYKFFSFSPEKIQTSKFARAAKTICDRYTYYILEGGLAAWLEVCGSLPEVSLHKDKWELFERESLFLFSYILNSPEFGYLDKVEIGNPSDYIELGAGRFIFLP